MELPKITMDGNLKKAVFICLIVVFAFNLVVTPEFANRGDFEFHYEKSANLSTRSYAPLVHNIGNWFAYNKNNFLFFVVLISAFVTPLALWFVTRHWQTVFFYFSTQYFWFMLMTPSQAMAGLFLIVLLATKNNFVRFLALVGASISHGQGANLLLVCWLIVLFFEHIKDLRFFPACGTLLGKATPEFFTTQVGGNPSFGVSIATILNFFVKIMPLPFLVPAILQLWKQKYFAPLAIALFGIIGAFYSSDRALYIVPIVLLPFAGAYVANAGTKTRAAIYLMALGLLGLQIYSWMRVKTACV